MEMLFKKRASSKNIQRLKSRKQTEESEEVEDEGASIQPVSQSSSLSASSLTFSSQTVERPIFAEEDEEKNLLSSEFASSIGVSSRLSSSSSRFLSSSSQKELLTAEKPQTSAVSALNVLTSRGGNSLLTQQLQEDGGSLLPQIASSASSFGGVTSSRASAAAPLNVHTPQIGKLQGTQSVGTAGGVGFGEGEFLTSSFPPIQHHQRSSSLSEDAAVITELAKVAQMASKSHPLTEEEKVTKLPPSSSTLNPPPSSSSTSRPTPTPGAKPPLSFMNSPENDEDDAAFIVKKSKASRMLANKMKALNRRASKHTSADKLQGDTQGGNTSSFPPQADIPVASVRGVSGRDCESLDSSVRTEAAGGKADRLDSLAFSFERGGEVEMPSASAAFPHPPPFSGEQGGNVGGRRGFLSSTSAESKYYRDGRGDGGGRFYQPLSSATSEISGGSGVKISLKTTHGVVRRSHEQEVGGTTTRITINSTHPPLSPPSDDEGFEYDEDGKIILNDSLPFAFQTSNMDQGETSTTSKQRGVGGEYGSGAGGVEAGSSPRGSEIFGSGTEALKRRMLSEERGSLKSSSSSLRGDQNQGTMRSLSLGSLSPSRSRSSLGASDGGTTVFAGGSASARLLQQLQEAAGPDSSGKKTHLLTSHGDVFIDSSALREASSIAHRSPYGTAVPHTHPHFPPPGEVIVGGDDDLDDLDNTEQLGRLARAQRERARAASQGQSLVPPSLHPQKLISDTAAHKSSGLLEQSSFLSGGLIGADSSSLRLQLGGGNRGVTSHSPTIITSSVDSFLQKSPPSSLLGGVVSSPEDPLSSPASTYYQQLQEDLDPDSDLLEPYAALDSSSTAGALPHSERLKLHLAKLSRKSAALSSISAAEDTDDHVKIVSEWEVELIRKGVGSLQSTRSKMAEIIRTQTNTSSAGSSLKSGPRLGVEMDTRRHLRGTRRDDLSLASSYYPPSAQNKVRTSSPSRGNFHHPPGAGENAFYSVEGRGLDPLKPGFSREEEEEEEDYRYDGMDGMITPPASASFKLEDADSKFSKLSHTRSIAHTGKVSHAHTLPHIKSVQHAHTVPPTLPHLEEDTFSSNPSTLPTTGIQTIQPPTPLLASLDPSLQACLRGISNSFNKLHTALKKMQIFKDRNLENYTFAVEERGNAADKVSKLTSSQKALENEFEMLREFSIYCQDVNDLIAVKKLPVSHASHTLVEIEQSFYLNL